jgi:hypothetical protein
MRCARRTKIVLCEAGLEKAGGGDAREVGLGKERVRVLEFMSTGEKGKGRNMQAGAGCLPTGWQTGRGRVEERWRCCASTAGRWGCPRLRC